MGHIIEAGKQIFQAFPEAICAGLVIATACSFLGTLVVLKRLVFIGATLSEVAAFGIAAALFFHIQPFLGAITFTLIAVTLLAFSSEEKRVPRDALMAAIFIFASGLSVLLVSKSGFGLEEVKSLLYGDLIITSSQDLKVLLSILLPAIILISLFIRPIVYTFVDREEAKVLGIRVRLWELLFYYILGIVVSAASKLGGMLLVFCYLVVPPMAGLMISNRLKGAVFISIVLAILSTLLGFYFSYVHDLPTNQAIVVVASFLLCCVWIGKAAFSVRK